MIPGSGKLLRNMGLTNVDAERPTAGVARPLGGTGVLAETDGATVVEDAAVGPEPLEQPQTNATAPNTTAHDTAPDHRRIMRAPPNMGDQPRRKADTLGSTTAGSPDRPHSMAYHPS